jgi:hypothetical protein
MFCSFVALLLNTEDVSKAISSAPLPEHHQIVPLAPRMARFSLLPAPRRLRGDGNENKPSKSEASEARRDDKEKGEKKSFMGKAGNLLKSFGGGGFF